MERGVSSEGRIQFLPFLLAGLAAVAIPLVLSIIPKELLSPLCNSANQDVITSLICAAGGMLSATGQQLPMP